LSATTDSVSRNISFNFKPVLSGGMHELNIMGKNNSGYFDNTPGYSIRFSVSDQLQIMNPYNFPNPFSSGTYFTFELTEKPEELSIRIYTAAGRMIKEIKKTSAELNTGYNRIFWEGTDEDNDKLGNGVYFYKITAGRNGIKCSVIQKLAKIE
jgi:flagellar hook assembly protein FlgD